MPDSRVSLLVFTLLATLGSPPAHGDVTALSDHGFDLEITVDVPADRDATFAAFVDVGKWWNPDHTWFGKASDLSIDPVAGGCFCESGAAGSAMHMQVTYVRPGVELHMSGGLGPLRGLGLSGIMAFQFEPLESGTRIKHVYKVRGHLADGFDGLSAVVDNVQAGQLARLKAYLEQ